MACILHQSDPPESTAYVTFLFSLNQFHGCSEWYLQKQRNPWYLPSVNQYLSKILLDDWKITPRTTNIAETSHAATNADTSTQLPLLPAILVSVIFVQYISTSN